ncbi:MFS transporter [Flavobacterium sp. L1I52]|uniref:MFS transporter n=1 Tax=Flavobacterium pokkalii TaxID=1940408 RepID=A0ABR7UR99_9FLAO|nr:MFS transporter [Flavobacterium pokkalii]MBD0724523.1 MFS transporter [Flavobacterium pokkalii]
MKKNPQAIPFTSYQKFAIFILAITQFTVILDFMVMSPLGDILMKSMQIKPSHFGLVVSAYAFSAGISGLLTAGFADKFDRKKLLLFFYTGFILGTILCGLVNSYPLLVAARIITGLFGGVIGSISMAIVTDLFSMQQRGRVMGFIQMAFGASQIFGIPLGLYIATAWDWHAPFLWVAAMAVVIAVLIALKLKPLTEHLAIQKENSPAQHLLHTISKKEYRIGFAATAILSLGGFMLMPFGSAFAINNLKITEEQLPLIFMIAGLSTLIIMPVIGKLSDKIDKFKIFTAATIWTIITVAIYTNLSETPFLLVALINVIMMMGVMSRMVPSTALVTSVPAKEDRGAFMSINSSLQQISGGIAAAFAGTIVIQKDNFSPLEHYNTLGYIIIGISFISIILLSRVNQHLKKNPEQDTDTVISVSET